MQPPPYSNPLMLPDCRGVRRMRPATIFHQAIDKPVSIERRFDHHTDRSARYGAAAASITTCGSSAVALKDAAKNRGGQPEIEPRSRFLEMPQTCSYQPLVHDVANPDSTLAASAQLENPVMG